MKKQNRFERGQALILIVFAIVGLIGITGLAVDGGLAFSDRRHAQNAADTAALAGAMAKINVNESTTITSAADRTAYWKNIALNMADENGYSGDLVNSQVDVYSCDEASAECEAPYTGSPDYIQVIIASNFNTFFARVLGVSQMHNRVQAIAKAKVDESGPLGNGEAIVSYATQCETPVNFTVGGGASVTLEGGGMFVNNEDPSCGFVCNTNAGTITGDITTVGGSVSTSDHCAENIDGTISEGSGSLLDFPVTLDDIGMDIPPECDAPQGTYKNFDPGYIPSGFDPVNPYPGYPTEPVTVLYPGRYGQFPPPKDSPALALKDTMLLMPGTYCVSDVIRWNQDKFVMVGHDVTLFIRSGYDFSFTGGIIDIDAPNSGPYAGYLIVVEPDYGDPLLSASPEDCYINGNTNNDYEGTIFAPYCNCNIDGGSTPTGFNAQVLCYTVKITGTSTINFTYDPGVNGEQIKPPKIGLTH